MVESNEDQKRFRPSEIEIFQLIEKAKQQYEESMRLADLASISDIMDTDEVVQPRYAWDNPIGLTMTSDR
ncbi:MAG: hypothetical protein OXC63_11635 [Aestuariivita sp.]|nr:hypothetical protein [Aestuariivita sp.]MCY4346899.1 hypothetical protein [Aestuariivita sp.]